MRNPMLSIATARYMAVICLFAGTMAASTTRAAAAEFCVSCAGPDAHYACTFNGASEGPGDAGLKLYCITELAKSGKHASCSVDRTAAKPCAGDVKVLAMPDGLDTPPVPVSKPEATKSAASDATATGAPKAAEPTKAAAAPEVPANAAPPKTVQEMVEKGTSDASKSLEKGGNAVVETAKSTGGVIDKASKAVGDTAKKTWTCITSFFGDC
jgi:hypothetical protein